MRPITVIAGLAALLLALVLCFPAWSAEYSGEMVMQEQGAAPQVMKVYVKGKKRRQEPEGGEQIMIFRPDRGVLWLLLPADKVYMEMNIDSGMAPSGPAKEAPAWSPQTKQRAVHVGKETISGVMCDKFKIPQENVTYWISEVDQIPLRIEHPGGVLYYRKFQRGGLADSLFEIPPGYSRAGMMGAMGPSTETTAGSAAGDQAAAGTTSPQESPPEGGSKSIFEEILDSCLSPLKGLL